CDPEDDHLWELFEKRYEYPEGDDDRGELRPLDASEPPNATVATAGAPLNVRSSPSTDAPIVGELPNGTGLYIQCTATAELVTAAGRETSTGNSLGRDLWVSDGFVQVRPDAAPISACTAAQLTRGSGFGTSS